VSTRLAVDLPREFGTASSFLSSLLSWHRGCAVLAGVSAFDKDGHRRDGTHDEDAEDCLLRRRSRPRPRGAAAASATA